MARGRVPDDVTVCLTSCGRFDLLRQTLDQFLGIFDAPKLIIAEDSGDPAMKRAIAERYPSARLLFNEARLGQFASIDRMYAEVETPFIFHTEDDWSMDAAFDFDDLKRALDEHPAISGVCVRKASEINAKFLVGAHRFRCGASDFAHVSADVHPDWFGYSFNPGLARRETFLTIGPFARFGSEQGLSVAMRGRGMTIAYLLPGVARHIGGGRHVDDPFQPKRPRGFFSRLRASVGKRARRFFP